MIEKIKKAVHYISANHQELVASVRAIGLEMPKGFSALYEGEHVRFKGWILPFQSEDEIEWFVENEGCVVGSHELRIKRPDVLLHYKIQTNLTEYQGFDFSVEIGSFDKVFLKVNSVLIHVWNVMKFNSVPERLISPAAKEFREVHRAIDLGYVAPQGHLEVDDNTTISSDFVNLGVDEFIAYFSSNCNFTSNAKSLVKNLRAVDWALSFIKACTEGSNNISIPGFFSDSPVYCRFSVVVIDLNFIYFSNEFESFYLVQHCANVCLIFPEHFIVASLTDVNPLVLAAKDKLNELSRTVRKFINKINIREGSNFGGLLISQSRPYHYIYDYLFGLNALSNGVDKKFDIYGVCGFDFFDLSCFDNCSSYKSIPNDELNKECFDEKKFLVMPCLQYVYSNYDRGLTELSRKLIKMAEKLQQAETHGNKFSAADLVVWIGLSNEKRSWVEQIDGFSNILSQLNNTYKRICVLVDGRTFPLTPRKADHDNKAREDMLFEKLAFGNPAVRFINMIGLKPVEKIYLAEKIDFFISSYGTDSIYPSAICGKPGVVYAAKSIGIQRTFVVHKRIIEVPSDKISEVASKTGNSGSWHETSISMDWRDVYECVLQLIEKYRIN